MAGEIMGKLQPEASSKNPELLPLAHPSLPSSISPKSLGTTGSAWKPGISTVGEGFSLAGGWGCSQTCNSSYWREILSHSFSAGASKQSRRDVLGHGPCQGQELRCLGVPF